MYEWLKQIFKGILPKKTLMRWEPAFRALLYPFYKGDAYQCNLCGKSLRKFIEVSSGDRLCPYCGSIDRTRRLWQVLNDEVLSSAMAVLHFSPSRSLYRKMKKQPDIQYISTDLSDDFMADHHYDIGDIGTQDEQFDVIICYHVLEHIPDDQKAMQELHRVLKKGGLCLIQTPFKEGPIYEDWSIEDEEGRLKHFGQKDHVRIYSVQGLRERLEQGGFQVEAREFEEQLDNRHGFKAQETVLFCRK